MLVIVIKCFSNRVQPIEACFVILRFQIIFSIKDFKGGFGKSNENANKLDFIVLTSLSRKPIRSMIAECTTNDLDVVFLAEIFKIV